MQDTELIPKRQLLSCMLQINRELEFKNINLLILTPPKLKHLNVTVIENVRDLKNENQRSKITDQYSIFTNRKETLILSRCQFFQAGSSDSTVSTRMPLGCFVNSNKVILRFIWRGKRPQIISIIVKEKKTKLEN